MINLAWCLSNNFGDVLSPWLTKRITGESPTFCNVGAEYQHYIVGGSMLNWGNKNSVIWGSGVASYTDCITPGMDVRAVRGPITRMRCLANGVKCYPIYGDPALLLPKFYKPKRETRRTVLGIVPHYVDQYRVFGSYPPEMKDVRVINILDSIEDVIENIVSCDYIVASALHGLVVADAYGIPNLRAKFSDSIGGDGMKYTDYFMSVGRERSASEMHCIDVRVDPHKPVEWWLQQRFEVGKPDTELLLDACPFNPKADPDKVYRKLGVKS